MIPEKGQKNTGTDRIKAKTFSDKKAESFKFQGQPFAMPKFGKRNERRCEESYRENFR